MSSTFELNVKTENLKAHYLVLMESVRSANEELTSKLEQRNILQNELDKINNEIKVGRLTLDSFLKATKQERIELKDLTESLNRKEKALNREEKETIKKLKNINLEISSKYAVLNEQITKKKDEINSLKIVSLLLEGENDIKIDEINSLQKQSEQRRGEDKELKKQIVKTEKEFNQVKKKQEKEIKKSSVTLVKLLKQIKDNKLKIESPLEYLRQRELEVEKKERNLKTLIRRFKIYYDKYFPDRELKI